MDHVTVDGATLAYEMAGNGEPAVFIHGALVADSFKPLLTQTLLGDSYRLVAYHRRGYRESSAADAPLSLAQQASDCRELLEGLSIERAHVVGHSFGGVVALQLAIEFPGLVHSLALLEPALAVGDSGPEYRESLKRGMKRYENAGGAVVADEFLRVRFGEGYREPLERLIPGALEQAATDAAASFNADLPGLMDWEFGESEAKNISQPALVVLGQDSAGLSPRFVETHETLLRWLPNAEGAVLTEAAHGLQMQNPSGMADVLADFWSRHPMK